MTVEAGIVCGACDWLNQPDCSTCKECGNELSLIRISRSAEDPLAVVSESSETGTKKENTPPDNAAQQETEGKPMEQARHYICSSCSSPVPSGHKFCGKCGTPGENASAATDPEYFGDMQVPGKAKLILIKGEGMDGISYHLNSTEHIAGRVQGAILFTEDNWLSPKHANFFYADDKLMIRDEDSVNGVFICARGPTDVPSGTIFLAGEQVFMIESVEAFQDEPEEDGTYYFSSPAKEASFKVVQILEGGGKGMVVHAKDNQLVIGREDADMNFPGDPYISGNHLKVEGRGNGVGLVDLGSKNGTYVKTSGEISLSHGDYLFLGRQLLRVEITN